MEVGPGMDKDDDRSRNAGDHVDTKPVSGPLAFPRAALFDGVHEDEQDDAQCNPSREVPELRVPERPIGPDREESFQEKAERNAE